MGNKLSQLCCHTKCFTTSDKLWPSLIISLPDEILIEIFSRLSLDSLPSIPFVCSRFSNILLNNPSFLRLRLQPTIHVFAISHDRNGGDNFISASLPLNTSNWSVSTRQRVPPSPLNHNPYSVVSLGRSVYIIDYEVSLRHDTWTKTTVPIAPTHSPFYRRVTTVNGKIYGSRSYGKIEEYDPIMNKWRVVSLYPTKIDALGGVVVGAGGLYCVLHSTLVGLIDALDISSGKWMGRMPSPLPGVGYVIGACGTPAGHVYMISIHSAELRFSKWEGIGEEWITLEPPVLPEKLRKFSCVAVGDERVVAIVDVQTRGIGRRGDTYVLVYSAVDGCWSQGPDLPMEFHWTNATLAITDY